MTMARVSFWSSILACVLASVVASSPPWQSPSGGTPRGVEAGPAGSVTVTMTCSRDGCRWSGPPRSGVGPAYRLLSFRWPGAQPRIPFWVSTNLQGNVPYSYSTSPHRPLFDDAVQSIVSAADQWNCEGGSNARFTFQGTTSTAGMVDDGINTVSWSPASCPYGYGCSAVTVFYLDASQTVIRGSMSSCMPWLPTVGQSTGRRCRASHGSPTCAGTWPMSSVTRWALTIATSAAQ